MKLQRILEQLSSPEPHQRREAIEGIGPDEVAPLVDTLIAHLDVEVEPSLLIACLDRIGRSGRATALDPASRYLEHEGPGVAAAALGAVRLLVITGLTDATRTRLESLSASRAHADLRFRARRILADHRAAASPASSITVDVETLRSVLSGSDTARKLSLLEGVVLARDRAVAALIAEVIPAEEDPRVLALMATVMKDAGTTEQSLVLRPLLRHADDRVAANAMEALVQLSDEPASINLLPLLARDDNRLRANLMIALFPRYPAQVMGYVGRMLKNEKLAYRISGLYCARFLDTAEIHIDVMRLLVTETVDEVFRTALDWVADYGPRPRALVDLTKLAVKRPGDFAPIEEAARKLRERVDDRSANRPHPTGFRFTASYPVLSDGPQDDSSSPSIPIRPPSSPGQRRTQPLRPLPTGAVAPPSQSWRRWSLTDYRVSLGLGLVGLALTAALTLGRIRGETVNQDKARALAAQAVSDAIDARVVSAMVRTVGGQSNELTLEVLIQGQVYTLHTPAPSGKSVRPGTTLRIRGARMEHPKGTSPRLVAAEVKIAAP